ncbi:ORFV2 [Goose circovirus]|uniref:V2 n=1 Tax=Goose circovirus TaxID=146032 RepID=Q8AYY4_GOCV|nr:ORFV2 [Goose circovirus]AAN37985.1 ORFV2 [Goose circovirus]AAN37989.1 ORFV2 [Goose circovirus]ABA39167.1 V2 [Goose circovirus]ABA39171.1 V2 [Goose circovirus]
MFWVCFTLKIVYLDLIRPMCSLRRLYRRLRLAALLRR